MTDRKYIELSYTFEEEVARITAGLHEKAHGFEHPVHMFVADGGVLVAVTVECDDETPASEAMEMALDLAEEALDEALPGDVDDHDDPWRVLCVDHDLMAENLRNTRFLPDPVKVTPTEPVAEAKPEDPEDGVLAATGGGE